MKSVNYKIDFVGNRKWYYLLSLIAVGVGIISLFLQGLNLGIDFVSGTRLDIHFPHTVDLEKARGVLKDLGYSEPEIRLAGKHNEILIFRLDRSVERQEIQKLVTGINQAFHTKVNVQEQTVDPIIGRELARNAIISVLIACLGIGIYVMFRFEYRFAVAAIISLLHDALFIVGVFSLFRLEVDIVFIAAVLTIVGYSVNDTIVVFDRIRENMERIQPKKFEDLRTLVNESINQVLVRSLNTVITVVIAATALFLFGGESIHNFSLALLLGLISGAYSSIFIASQIWVDWKWHSMKKENAANPATVE
jgi:preprotein translocase subunit SecF